MSAKCKIIMTAVLTVMSDMDPDTISQNLGWVWVGWEVCSVMCCLGRSTVVNYVVGSTSRF
jgi:hypothetical protein